MEGYKISTNIEEMDFPLIYQFISQTYWAKGIPKETFQKAINNLLWRTNQLRRASWFRAPDH
jgi:Gpi18-like mannosyltransferase